MHHPYWRTTVLAALLAACSNADGRDTVATAPSTDDQAPFTVAPTSEPERARHERLAVRFAKALRDPAFRATVAHELATSSFPEQKVHLQGFLGRNGSTERRRVAQLTSEPEGDIAADLDQGPAVEVYFPVPAHRARWDGGTDLLVGTAELDSDAPVAWDLMGRRHRLDPKTPPATPVLMVERAEQVFSPRPAAIPTCLLDCSGPGGNGGVPAPTAPQGLFMTQSQFTGTFEGWFKGDPEFEVHVLGQTGAANALTTYQCAGEHAGGPYAFDQNSTTWSGSVMLMSRAQLDQYSLQHPGQNLRIFVVEDDDTACEIRIDSTRTANLFKAVKLVYGDLTGGKDSTAGTTRLFRRAPMFLSLLKAITSFFKTDDDPVGNAVEDPYAAVAFFPGANWVIRGENSVINGAIKLEMR